MACAYNGLIQLVLFDVDGVLTDGTLHIGAEGEVFKSFNAKDGVAVALLRAHGVRCGIISGKASPALDFRARQLKFDLVVTGCHDKLSAYVELKRDFGLEDGQVAFVGDDVIDLPVMQKVGISYAPADAHCLVLSQANHITRAVGGKGVAREVAEHLLLLGGLTLDAAYQPLLDEWSRHAVQQ
ncbi:HAD-IIIA family hydrolase [Pseudomonas fluorescens]|uniref:KdsC family phosphatase n=1 Tax=Pseudomonas fluorescens TaxID=294 RepID=UPI00325626FD